MESNLDGNDRLLAEAFKLQNEDAYDECLDKLQQVGSNLVKMIEKIQSNSQFYMRHMNLMKEERDLVSEKDYKQFANKNEKVFSHNFERHYYRALLMQQLEEKEVHSQPKRFSKKQIAQLAQMVALATPLSEVQQYFSRHDRNGVAAQYQIIQREQMERGRP